MRFLPAAPLLRIASLVAALVACGTSESAGSDLEAVSFAAEPGELYVPLDEALRELGWQVQRDLTGRCREINGIATPPNMPRRLANGSELVNSTELQIAGAVVTREPVCNVVTVSDAGRSFTMIAGPKRVEISLAHQQMRAWQGGRLVLLSRISSGRHGSTPAGDFQAGPYKARMHYSSLFQNAPMPWSVQIYRHVFIHGFTYVPDFPASHGCIRLPLDGLNPAKFFYEWVDNGTPVRVMRS